MIKKQKQNLQLKASSDLLKTLDGGDKEDIRALFAFDSSDSNEEVLLRFKIWSAYFYPQYFKVEDAPFHNDIDKNNLAIYRGEIDSFIDGAFRGGAKTTRTKLFFCFALANDMDHLCRYLKIATKDIANAKQIVTDMFNHLAVGPVRYYYPEIFAKTPEKKQQTMGVFDTATGIKVKATTVGVEQRGQLQEDARPDIVWFDDFETRNTLRSAVTTQMLWDNMEEARTGLAEDAMGCKQYAGGCIYTCNYISERGNVHRLIEPRDGRIVMLTPIITKENKITWPARYTMKRIEQIEKSADDFAGEYMNEPSAGFDIYFDRSVLDNQDTPKMLKVIADRKIYANYNPSHMYGLGVDVGGGVGLDHSADVTIDFTTLPARVVSTYKNNVTKPDVYGHEVVQQGRRYGECLVGVENNKFDTVIQVLRTEDYPNIYFTEVKSTKAGMPPKNRTYGWNTNGATKYSMLAELKSAVEDGLLQLSDPDLIAELRSYTRDDLMDRDEDVRLTTRHFDLLIAVAIAWAMRKHAVKGKNPNAPVYKQPDYESPLIS